MIEERRGGLAAMVGNLNATTEADRLSAASKREGGLSAMVARASASAKAARSDREALLKGVVIYRTSKGKDIPMSEMAGEHLANAITKLERSGVDPVTLAALKAEQDRRG